MVDFIKQNLTDHKTIKIHCTMGKHSMCTAAPSPQEKSGRDSPRDSLHDFSWGEGVAVHRLGTHKPKNNIYNNDHELYPMN